MPDGFPDGRDDLVVVLKIIILQAAARGVFDSMLAYLTAAGRNREETPLAEPMRPGQAASNAFQKSNLNRETTISSSLSHLRFAALTVSGGYRREVFQNYGWDVALT